MCEYIELSVQILLSRVAEVYTTLSLFIAFYVASLHLRRDLLYIYTFQNRSALVVYLWIGRNVVALDVVSNLGH